ncbi:unnamed protein product, partial [Choristocarpus tenellus]
NILNTLIRTSQRLKFPNMTALEDIRVGSRVARKIEEQWFPGIITSTEGAIVSLVYIGDGNEEDGVNVNEVKTVPPLYAHDSRGGGRTPPTKRGTPKDATIEVEEGCEVEVSGAGERPTRHAVVLKKTRKGAFFASEARWEDLAGQEEEGQ